MIKVNLFADNAGGGHTSSTMAAMENKNYRQLSDRQNGMRATRNIQPTPCSTYLSR